MPISRFFRETQGVCRGRSCVVTQPFLIPQMATKFQTPEGREVCARGAPKSKNARLWMDSRCRRLSGRPNTQRGPAENLVLNFRAEREGAEFLQVLFDIGYAGAGPVSAE